MGKPPTPLKHGTLRDRSPDVAFGKMVQQFRRAKGLTQEQLSWATGMSRVYISELERGLREPGLGTILKLSLALERPAAEIVGAVEEEIRGQGSARQSNRS